jgi:hypothetical protein
MKSLVTAAAFVAAVAWPAEGFCASLDDLLHCTVSAHDFISTLIGDGSIDRLPFHVESNSINAFDPAHGADLHAFGFHVFAVVGYEEGDPLFRKGAGKRLSTSAYGAVVWGATQDVQSAVTVAQSSAIVHHVGPHITAIFCDREQ